MSTNKGKNTKVAPAQLFEKFGEFDSVEELNKAAATLKAEGNEDGLFILAEENGIDKEDAESYIDDCFDELATPLMATIGKLKVEVEDLKLSAVLLDWVQELTVECTESEEMARAVRKKGKSLDRFIALLADYGFKNRAVVDKRIVDKCSKEIKNIVGNHEFSIGIPDKLTRKKLMQQYYLGK